MTVTRDATSGKCRPAIVAEATALLSGTGIGNPSIGVLCQEAAGNLADSFGTFTFAKTGAGANITYQNAIAGESAKAINLLDGNIAMFSNADAGLPNIGTTSMLLFAWVVLPATSPATERSAVTFGTTFGSQVAANLNTNKLKAIANPNSVVGTAVMTATVRPLIVAVNRTGGVVAIRDDLETLAPALTATPTGKSIMLGGDFTQTWFAPSMSILGFWVWFGAAAELDASHQDTLLDRFQNGPAVTSIAVTPSAPVLAPIGATQQLTATATRADGSTYDATATATWSSLDPLIATVSVTGLVTAVASGSTVITASFTSLNATPASGTSTVTVNGALSPPNKYTRMMMALLPPGKLWR